MFVISAICLLLLVYLIDHTKIGKAIQATSYNIKASALMGINTDFIIIAIFALGGFFCRDSRSIVWYEIHGLSSDRGYYKQILYSGSFRGLGSLPGAVIGSVLLGIIETFTSGYISSQYRDLIAFVLLIGVLVVKPSGLMGKTTEDKA